ncbi:MAG: HD domain-containing protein [bacterium]
MKVKYRIDGLRVGDIVTMPFLVTSHAMKRSRDGVDYLNLTLADRTGTLEGRVWTDAHSLAQRCAVDDFVAVRGEVESYGDRLSLTIHDLERLADDEVDLTDFFPHSRWSADAMFRQLLDLVEEHVISPPLRAFLDAVFADEHLVARFKQAPAAMRNHHAYRGGLLEHCLSMSRLAVAVSQHYAAYYPGMIQRDLVVAGCILHDLAKCDELDFRRSVRYSTAGRLIGHIPLGSEWVSQYARQAAIPVPDDLVMELKHLVLSHHGKHEYGSPVVPQTPEAHVLHHIDMMDSRINAFGTLRPTGEHREYWTEFQRSLEAPLYFRGGVGWIDHDTLREEDLLGPGLAAKPAPESPVNLDLFGKKP